MNISLIKLKKKLNGSEILDNLHEVLGLNIIVSIVT